MTSCVGSRSGARNGKALSPGFLERQWKPGQSGNPSGQAAEYGEVVRLARSLTMRAIERLGELMESEDERVVAVACNAILDRAFGKPREHHEREVDQFDRMSREELEEHIAKQMTAWGWVKLATVKGPDD
jgi:hypothetical protein